MSTHWFWIGVIVLCIAWYAFVTLVVAVRGARDVRSLLEQLRR